MQHIKVAIKSSTIIQLCNSTFQINLEEDEFMNITDSLRLGLYVPDVDEVIPIATTFQLSANIKWSINKGPFAINSEQPFDDIVFPYEFRLDFCQYLGKNEETICM